MASKKDLAVLIKIAIEAGWRVERTKSGHYKWLSPNSIDFFYSSSTPSDNRALENLKQDLRRRGLDVRKR
jgi:hypothetical protein